MGGPNLLRSQVVLMDQQGELILPDRPRRAQGARHAGAAAAGRRRQGGGGVHPQRRSHRARSGAPPETDAPPPNPIVGDAAAGQAYFAAKCSSCHSPTGDLQGSRPRSRKARRCRTSGSRGGRTRARRPGRSRRAGTPDPQAADRDRDVAVGREVEGPVVRIDNFLITIAWTTAAAHDPPRRRRAEGRDQRSARRPQGAARRC